MGKRRSGPSGPDRTPEPFETETPDAALEHDKTDCGCAQPCLDAALDQFRDALEGLDLDRVIYDSGWDETTDFPVRVIVSAGASNPALWEWVRRVAFLRAGPWEQD